MRLFEHPDFEQAVLGAAEYFAAAKLREDIIEKDYYVTEALRLIAIAAGDKVIFKGGTSLSKGWNLIQRFSEDIDLFLDPLAFQPTLGKKGKDRELKKLRDAVAEHPALSLLPESKTIGGYRRSDYFAYRQRFGSVGGLAPRLLLESGTASGREPTSEVQLESYLAKYLKATGVSLNAEDESPFSLRLLHFRRTFVEKMFAIHAKVELLKRDGRPIGSYARHYYDLFQLSNESEVLAMLQSDEYASIKENYDKISREHFPKSYFYPDGMRFAQSDAMFPPDELVDLLGAEYEHQCETLCFGAFPAWRQVLARLQEIREFL